MNVFFSYGDIYSRLTLCRFWMAVSLTLLLFLITSVHNLLVFVFGVYFYLPILLLWNLNSVYKYVLFTMCAIYIVCAWMKHDQSFKLQQFNIKYLFYTTPTIFPFRTDKKPCFSFVWGVANWSLEKKAIQLYIYLLSLEDLLFAQGGLLGTLDTAKCTHSM